MKKKPLSVRNVFYSKKFGFLPDVFLLFTGSALRYYGLFYHFKHFLSLPSPLIFSGMPGKEFHKVNFSRKTHRSYKKSTGQSARCFSKHKSIADPIRCIAEPGSQEGSQGLGALHHAAHKPLLYDTDHSADIEHTQIVVFFLIGGIGDLIH